MNIDDFKERLVALEQGRERAVANIHATDGAIQEVKYWIAKLSEPVKKPRKGK